ncbi:MAG: helicase-related protein, partial [Pseudomonadota bacterium]
MLITTPESLNILLSSTGGRSMLTALRVVILDEIHAVIGSKRGVHLITAVDRLVLLSGEFQRLALSATIKPLETVASFVGGYRLEGEFDHPRYLPRPVSIVESRMAKQYDARVRFPPAATEGPQQESAWEPLVSEFKKIINRNHSTLIFTNSRRLAEKLTLKINQDQDRPVAYAHHGSLSREIRGEVERKLKTGDLEAIVATNSLELGIDIGALDEVILVQSPPSVSAAVQRVGRAGHNVGQDSRGTIFPTHAQDLLEAAVLCAAIVHQNIEEIKPVSGALDVLAQVIVSMAGAHPWDIDELYICLKTSYPYRHLSREQFDLVLNMLAGRYSDARIRELKPRLSIDRLDNTVAARQGALRLLYTSGGTIPDRGYFQMRHQETNLRLGELDEEFVWEARIGQTFTLGTQNWRIERITHNDVFVLPARPTAGTPFWHGEEIGRDFHFSELISSFLEQADERLESPEFLEALKKEHYLDQAAAEHLISFLKMQKQAAARPLPHRHHLLVEHVRTGPGGVPGNQVVLHNFWGLKLNRPYALALEAAWEERYGGRIEIYAANDCVILVAPDEVRADEFLSLVTAANLEMLLRKRLEGSGYFAARFRECAGRALLLVRQKFSERRPLWMTRLKSRKLLDSVRRYHDFPILLEAWRTCLQDEFDLPNLKQVLSELESGAIVWSETRNSLPSPMTRSVTWRHISEYMYMTDEPAGEAISSLSRDLLREVVFSPGLRPAVSVELVSRFELKRRRLADGYSPSSPQDLLEWVKERLLIPASEWENLLEAVKRDHGLEADSTLGSIGPKLAWITPPLAGEPLLASLELLPRIMAGFYSAAEGVPATGFNHEPIKIPPALKAETDELLSPVLGEWLQFYGPVTGDFILQALGLNEGRLLSALEDLSESGTIIGGRLTQEGAGDE